MARTPTIEVKFTGDTRDLERATGKATAEISGVGKSVSGFAVGAGAALTSFGIQAIPQLLGVGQELYALGQASEIGLAKSETVFGDSAGSIATWADSVNESLGLSDEKVIGLAASMGDLLVPLGFTREAAADMTMETTELAGALSAWSQGQYDAEQVSGIVTKAMLGERDGLKALGISISQAEVDQRALEIAQLDGRDAITAQDKALATQQLILDKSTDAQTAWSDGTMDAVKSQNELSATIADAKEGLAKGLVPVVQSVVRWITSDLIPAVRAAVEQFKVWWPQIKEAVLPTMQAIQETVSEVLALVAELWDRYGSDILDQVVSQFEMIKGMIEGTMKTIQGIIDVVMGLISGDWGRVWEGIKGIVEGVWTSIRAIVERFIDIIRTLLAVAWEGIKRTVAETWEGIKTTISNAVGAVVGFVTGIPGRIASTVSGMFSGIGTAMYEARESVRGWVSDVVGYATGLPGRLAGKFSGMWDGIKTAFRSAVNAVIRGWNGLQFTLPGVSTPFGTVGGFTIGTPNIPYLAQGGLITAPMLAWVGDNKGAGSGDPEIVAPLSKLAPMLVDALSVSSRSLGSPRRTSSSERPVTIIQNYPTGVTPTTVTQASRQYERTQGPL